MNFNNPLETEFLTIDDVSLVPKFGTLNSRSEAILKPFIYSAPMDTVTGYALTDAMLKAGEYPVVSRFLKESELKDTITSFAKNPNCFFAVGFDKGLSTFLDIVSTISDKYEWTSDTKINLALDIAHGDMAKAHATSKVLRSYGFVGNIMSGSICTPDAAIRAIESGCTHLRIGVGPGAVCSTRRMTGVGVPQLSAVYLIAKTVQEQMNLNHIQIIADGGIKEPGDAVRYLAAGATGIMLGSVLSRTLESAGWESITDYEIQDYSKPISGPPAVTTTLKKQYRGQASASFQTSQFGQSHRCPEGVTSNSFTWDGESTVDKLVGKFRGGCSSAISYLGIESMSALTPANVEFIRITPSAHIEGAPNGNH